MDSMTSLLVEQLGYRAPVLLTCLVGFILSLIFWRRAPRPCLLVLLAATLEAVLSLSYAAAVAYIVTSRAASGASIGARLSTVGIAVAIVSPVPYVLLMIAAFTGRSNQGVAAFLVNFPRQVQEPHGQG